MICDSPLYQQARSLRRVSQWALLSVLALGAAAGCLPHTKQPGHTSDQSANRSEAKVVRARAQAWWEAKRDEDWQRAFEYVHPAQRADATVEQYIAWCEKEEPFRVHSFSLGQVLVDGDYAWVEVDSNKSIRKFPKFPPREGVHWERWRRVDGAWYPLPAAMLETCPTSPALRNADEEARLAKRFEAAWIARKDRDWKTLYDLGDPNDREAIPYDQFERAYELLTYLDSEVHWVEVVGQRGTVRVTYRHKLNDPNLTKLPVDTTTMNEDWILVDGEWYVDNKRPES